MRFLDLFIAVDFHLFPVEGTCQFSSFGWADLPDIEQTTLKYYTKYVEDA